MRQVLLIVLGLFILPGPARAEEESTNPDEFQRVNIELPGNRGTVRCVKYLNRNWVEKRADVLLLPTVEGTLDVCFDLKFKAFDGEVLTPANQDGRLLCKEPEKQAFLRTLKVGQNIWVCGTLQPVTRGKGVELYLVDVLKRPDDLALYTARLMRLQRAADGPGLLELGHEVQSLLEKNLLDFRQIGEFETLQNTAWVNALELKEKRLDRESPDDADAYYELGEQWSEMLKKNSERYRLVRKVLEKDPRHPRAGRVAREEMGLVPYKQRWVTQDERRKLEDDERVQAALDEAQRKAKAAADKLALVEATKDRQPLLTSFQLKLRTRDPAVLDAGLRSLAEKIQVTPDVVFARQGTEVLVHTAGLGAVFALAQALKSPLPETRVEVYEALAWRGQDEAFKVLAAGLLSERDPPAARAGVEAVVRRADVAAVRTLVEVLHSGEPKVVTEAIEGLRALTGRDEGDRNAWLRWWEQNKTRSDLVPVNKG